MRDLFDLTDHAFALLKFAKSHATLENALNVHICSAVFTIAGLRAFLGDLPLSHHRPIFALAGPIQRELEEKSSALTRCTGELDSVRTRLERQMAVNDQQLDHIRGLEARSARLAKNIDDLRQELAAREAEPSQQRLAAVTVQNKSLMARLEDEQLNVMGLQQQLMRQQPECDARVRTAEAQADKNARHVQYLTSVLHRHGVDFKEDWGIAPVADGRTRDAFQSIPGSSV